MWVKIVNADVLLYQMTYEVRGLPRSSGKYGLGGYTQRIPWSRMGLRAANEVKSESQLVMLHWRVRV